ncbi:MAG: 3-isopropylmalate dehydratase large subunit, partial [Candidatus Kapabacteria bacterium]|nr:3-isopropylmalate dehydratase large subunit [Candidatus Kapabacteria bacterium]
MSQTIVQKILAKASGRQSVEPGEVLEPKVSLAMSHENAALVLNQFQEIYKDLDCPAKVWNPSKIAIIFDHRVPAESKKTATNQKKVRNFINEQGITK